MVKQRSPRVVMATVWVDAYVRIAGYLAVENLLR